MVTERFSCSSDIISSANWPITGLRQLDKSVVNAIYLFAGGARFEAVTENVKPVGKAHPFYSVTGVVSNACLVRIGTNDCEWLISARYQIEEHLIESSDLSQPEKFQTQ